MCIFGYLWSYGHSQREYNNNNAYMLHVHHAAAAAFFTFLIFIETLAGLPVSITLTEGQVLGHRPSKD